MSLPPDVLAKSLLPPNATDAERAIEDAMRVGADIGMVGSLWNPLSCPPEVLPFLAWGLAISRWDENWTLAQKRTETANAIAFHKRKGTRGIVEEVLARFHPLLTVVEWWETNPRGTPGTFEVRAPAPDIPASFLTAETAAAIIRDVASVKPVSRHFDFVQALEAQAFLWLDGGAMTASYGRFDTLATHDPDPRWGTYLLTEDGEPFETEDGQFLEA
jgi:phage tail P2-like protein